MLFVYVQSLYSSFLLYLQKFNVRLYNQYNRYFETCVLSKVQLSKQREFVGAYSIFLQYIILKMAIRIITFNI